MLRQLWYLKNANVIIRWYKDILQVNKNNTTGILLQVRETSSRQKIDLNIWTSHLHLSQSINSGL